MTTAPVGKHRAWCFTYNNYPEDLTEFNKFLEKYLYVYGYEVAPTTDTKHLQGFVEFNGGTTYKQLREKFEIFWTPAKGSRHDNFTYCTKSGRFESSHRDGFPGSKQGTRSDIQAVKDIINSGGGMMDVLTTTNSYPAARYAEMMLKYVEQPRDWVTEVTWIWGESGSGKSCLAKTLAPNAWWSGNNFKWFDGYDGQPDVVIDDLRAENWPFVFLLRLLDSKPFRVECKGGSRQWRARRIFVTTLRNPSETYRAGIEPLEQLNRRIKSCIHLAPAREVGGNKDVGQLADITPDEIEKIIEEFL